MYIWPCHGSGGWALGSHRGASSLVTAGGQRSIRGGFPPRLDLTIPKH
jgi:hypothetical protein